MVIANSKILSNFIHLNVINLIGLFIPILTMPLLNSALTAKIYSQFLLGMTIYQFGVIFIDYSFNLQGVRYIARTTGNVRKNFYSEAQVLRLLLLLIYSFVILLYTTFSENLAFSNYLIAILPGLIGHLLFAQWYYLATSNLKKLSIYLLLSRLVFLVGVLTIVNEPEDLNVALLCNSLPMFLFSFVCIPHKIQINNVTLKRCFIRFKNGLSLFWADFLPNFYNTFPILIFGILYNGLVLAAYIAAIRLINAISSLQQNLGKAIFPLVLGAKTVKIKQIVVVNVLFALILTVALLLSKEIIINFLLDKTYQDTITYLSYLAWSLPALAVYVSLTNGFFIPRKKDVELKNITIKSVFVSILIGSLCVYFLGIIGGVIMFLIARFNLAFFSMLKYKMIKYE